MRYMSGFGIGVLLALQPWSRAVPNALTMRDGAQSEAISVPFVLDYGGHVLVKVRVNDNMTGTFCVDTGSRATVVTDEVVARLGLKPARHQDGQGKPIVLHGRTMPEIRPDSVRIGPFRPGGPFIAVVSADVLAGTADHPLDGLIGSDALDRCAILLDYKRRVLTLWPVGRLTAKQRDEAGLSTAYSCPLSWDDGRLALDVTVNGELTFPAYVDTGAPATTLPAAVATNLKLAPLGTGRSDPSFYGGMKTHWSEVASLAVGAHFEYRAAVSYRDTDDVSAMPGVLGADFLRRFLVLIDYPEKMIYFRPVVQQVTDLTCLAPETSMILVEATLSDGKAHVMKVEPRAYSVLDEAVARSLGLVTNGRVYTSLKLKGGAVSLDDVGFVAEAMPTTLPPLPKVDGVIGGDALSDFAIRMDLMAHRVQLVYPGHLEGTDQVAKAARLPWLNTGHGPAVAVRVDDVMTTFGLDLLADDRPTLRARSLVDSLRPLASATEVGEDSRHRRMRLRMMQFGAVVWNRPVVTDGTSDSSDQPNGLGASFCRRYCVTMDTPGRVLYIEPTASSAAETDDLPKTGISASVRADGQQVVATVVEPSPASEAGIRAGDTIVSIAGLEVGKVPLDQIAAKIPKTEGDEVVFVVRHEGETQTHECRIRVRKLL